MKDNPNEKDFIQQEAEAKPAANKNQSTRTFVVVMCVLGAILLGCAIYGLATDSFGSVMGVVGSVALALLVLLVMITVHELGHYVAGKLLGFGITEFALGFGPSLYRRQRKNGEYFSVRALPIGGFCAFEGEDEDSTSPTAFNNRKPWQRIIVLVAGATMNFILALLLIAMLFGIYGQTLISSFEVVPTVEYSQSLQSEDVIVKLDGKNIYMQTNLISALDGKKKGDVITAEVYRDGEFKQIKVTLREDVNAKNSTDLYAVSRALGIATITQIIEVEEGSVFNKGDVIFRGCTSVYENDVNAEDSKYLKEQRIYDEQGLYEYLKNYSAGDTVMLWLYRGDDYYRLDFTLPDGFENITAEQTFELLGVTSTAMQDRWASDTIRLGFFDTVKGVFVYSFKIAGTIFTILGELITGALGIDAMGGTVTTIVMTSQVIRTGGLQYMLEIAGYIGVNLAVFNLLPIPALDGSRVVFTVIEMIRRKPINKNIEGIIHTVGLFLLLGFAVLVDLLQLF